jgi:hypothetical protein
MRMVAHPMHYLPRLNALRATLSISRRYPTSFLCRGLSTSEKLALPIIDIGPYLEKPRVAAGTGLEAAKVSVAEGVEIFLTDVSSLPTW